MPPADEILRTFGSVLAPLVRLLLASGLDYTRLIAELKPLFIEQARLELLRTGQADTNSAISLLSGVHRKDVREWRENGLRPRISQELSMSSRVFARWVQDPVYRDRRKRPKALPRLGPAPSFDTLARSVTQDVHPYTVLTELIRLGLVKIEERKGEEYVVPEREGFVPSAGSREILQFFSGNLSDHASAAVANLLGDAPRLEQSVIAEGITRESADHLAELARKLWSQVRSEMIAEATRRYAADQDREDATCRARFGAYYWEEERQPDQTTREVPATGEQDEKH
jgi:uncharacterized protein DUF6502